MEFGRKANVPRLHWSVMDSPDEAIVRDSLYNWLGFGNPNGKYWFIGREESINLGKCRALADWTDYFNRRRDFDVATDFRRTWEEVYGRPLTTWSTTTWHYQVAFLLAFRGLPISSDRVKRIAFEDPQFARTFSNHFSGEFFPCPKKSENTIEPYGHIWDSPAAYRAEVAPGRIQAFTEQLEASPDVDWIITYSPAFVSHFGDRYSVSEVRRWPNLVMDPIVLSRVTVGSDRSVNLLEIPFLGYGRIGYDAIEQVVSDISST